MLYIYIYIHYEHFYVLICIHKYTDTIYVGFDPCFRRCHWQTRPQALERQAADEEFGRLFGAWM